ncbi:MAG TPA: glycosyltransferase family 4 protein [Atribacterota bacterium]|nr:glycosyltransferase family 4 protein [Atribacterota bacterium]
MNKIKIFIITTGLPARIGGAPVRNFNLIKNISKDMFSVSLFTIVDSKTKKLLPTIEKELGIPIYSVPFKGFGLVKKIYVSLVKRVMPYMEEYKESGINDILFNKLSKEPIDIIQLEEINAYYAIKDIIPFIKEKNIKIVLDAHNVEQIAFKEASKIFGFIKKTIGRWILPNFAKIENKAAKSVDHIFTCSDVDKAYFANIVNIKTITVIPNGADTMFFRTKKQVLENTLLFMGGVNYPPNEEALQYYFSEIYPLIKKKIPNIKIYALCGKPSQRIENIAKNDTSIIFPGFVVDVREYLNKAKICIAPLKSGSGTRLKILEYMAMGKPVVSTSKGAEGLEVESYKNILIADNPHDFANKIIWLIENPKEAKILGEGARELVKEKYDWIKIIKGVTSYYRKTKNESNKK